MKTLKYIVLTFVLVLTATTADAKRVKAAHMYIFGFSASFADSTLYITDIQDVPGAYYETSSEFLLGRDSYSAQLKEYLAETKGQPGRICLVMFATTKKKAEKKYQKLKKKYTAKDGTVYGMQHLKADEFRFSVVDLADE